MFEAILAAIKQFDTIIIHRHNRPDGDALGSQIGMKHLILENFPGKKVYTVGDDARFFGFMADSIMDEIPDRTYEGALAIILDTAARPLISDERYSLAAKTIRIDHHIFCEQIADEEVVDTSYESCCGMVTDFAVESNLTINSRHINKSNTLIQDTLIRYVNTDFSKTEIVKVLHAPRIFLRKYVCQIIQPKLLTALLKFARQALPGYYLLKVIQQVLNIITAFFFFNSSIKSNTFRMILIGT